MIKIMKKHAVVSSVFIGLLIGTVVLFFLGVPTDVIQNPMYARMIPASALDMFFMISTSILIAIYAGLLAYIFITKLKKISSKYGVSGAIGSFFAISCPICIQFLVWIFGSVFLMKYYNPLRPFIGFLSIGLLCYGVYYNIQIIRNQCAVCYNEVK